MSAAKPSPWEDVFAAGKAAGRFVVRHQLTLVLLLVVGSLGWSAWQVASAYRHRTVILYTGTSTADASRIGDDVKKHFAKNPPSWFVNYKIELRPSEGLKDNRRKVAESSPSELVIGFDQDGFSPPPEVRSLIPLSDMCLHPITHRGHVENALKRERELAAAAAGGTTAAPPPAAKAITLGRLIPFFRSKRSLTDQPLFFLGPKGSGSRQIAEQVLAMYPVRLRFADYGDHIGWDTAYRLLAAGEIDAVFDASDIGSPFIRDLARDPRYVLVGLDNVAAMTAGDNRFLQPHTFPRGSYSTDHGFCPTDVETVSTRRLLVCHQGMSTFDAFYLTAGIREAVRSSSPTIYWDRPPAQQPTTDLVCRLHDGAVDYRNNRQPLVWLWNVAERHWFTALSAVGGLVLLLWRNWRTRSADAPPPLALPAHPVVVPAATTAPVPTASGLPGVGEFLHECDRLQARVDALPPRPDQAALLALLGDHDRLWRRANALEKELGDAAATELEFPRLFLIRLRADLNLYAFKSRQPAAVPPPS